MKKMTIKNSLAALLLFAGLAFSGGTASAATSTQSVAFPMYEYPTIGTLWADIRAAGSQVPWIIANPATGPGTSVNSDYTTALNALPAGQRAVGYVNANYQARPINEVVEDMNTWYDLYPQVTGIFVDLLLNGGADELCYGATLHNYEKSKHPTHLTVFNFGQNVEAKFEPYGDIFANAENTYAVYSSTWTPFTDGFENNAAYANRFWHIIHTVNSSDLSAALARTRTNNAGWVLLTDNTMPNPYISVPSYWSTFLTGVGALPQSTIPNRGLTALPSGCIDLSLDTNTAVATGTKQINHTVTNTVNNLDATRTSWGSTTLTYSVPAGATVSSLSGTGWNCVVIDRTCTYPGNLGPNDSLPAVNALITTSCDYSSGSASITLGNFADNTAVATASLTKPADCAVASASTSSGTAAKKKKSTTTSTTEAATAEPVITEEPTVTTADPRSTSTGSTDSDDQTTELDAEDTSSNVLVLVISSVVFLALAGGAWWFVIRNR